MKVGKEIALEAKKKGICAKWFSDMLKQNDVKPLCEMYFRGDDWAMENDFPDLSILRKFRGNIDQYGMHTDFEGELSDQHNTALFGKSVARLNYGGFFAGTLIIRHDSKAEINISGNAFLVINLLDNAFVQVECTDEAKVIIYQYGTDSNFRITGNVDVREAKWEK